jgi:hypothetical protein
MLTFLLRIRTAWSDYFTETPTLLQKNEYVTRQTPSDTNVHISNCLFRSITSESAGGAFYSNGAVSSGGGAIYFSNSNNGQCVLHEVCGYDCCSTYTGGSYQFAYIYMNTNVSCKNYVDYSSIVRCVNANSNSASTLYLGWGKVYCPSTNISMNKCGCHSGIYSSASRYSFLYATFADNIANDHSCIRFWCGGGRCNFKSCNIIRNTQGTLNSGGTFWTADEVTVEDSCILENIATYIFAQANSYTFVVSNCTVDKTTRSGSFRIQNTITKSFILALNHMSTQNCNVEYDSFGYLTPIIPPPSQSPSKSQKPYCSCEKFIYQSRLRDFFSLLSIFIFNCIHPYDFIDLWYIDALN